MTPKLTNYVNVARHNLYGLPMSEEAAKSEKEQRELDEFRIYLAGKIDLSIRCELFIPAEWSWSEMGCSVHFSVDEKSFELCHRGQECRLLDNGNGDSKLLAILPSEDSQFTDRLLVTIGDALAD
jgi:hypothetical protein